MARLPWADRRRRYGTEAVRRTVVGTKCVAVRYIVTSPNQAVWNRRRTGTGGAPSMEANQAEPCSGRRAAGPSRNRKPASICPTKSQRSAVPDTGEPWLASRCSVPTVGRRSRSAACHRRPGPCVAAIGFANPPRELRHRAQRVLCAHPSAGGTGARSTLIGGSSDTTVGCSFR